MKTQRKKASKKPKRLHITARHQHPSHCVTFVVVVIVEIDTIIEIGSSESGLGRIRTQTPYKRPSNNFNKI